LTVWRHDFPGSIISESKPGFRVVAVRATMSLLIHTMESPTLSAATASRVRSEAVETSA